MDFPDYIRLLRRGWHFITVFVLVGLSFAALYLVVTPKEYVATASLLVVGADQRDVAQAAQAAQVSNLVAQNYAAVIQSERILRAAALRMSPRPAVADMRSSISSQARATAAVVDVVASTNSPRESTEYANAVAAAAVTEVPTAEAASSKSAFRLVLIDQATVPSSPSAPSVPGILLTGLILGLGAGLIVVIVRHAFDKRLRRPEDVTVVSDAPVLGLIPRRRGLMSGVALRDDPSGSVGEALRSLRTTVAALDDQIRRSVLFAPIEADVESAFVPLNLAWSLAQAGRSVLLVDADMRQSTVQRLLGASDSEGLADLLRSGQPFERFLQQTEYPNLDLIPSGRHSSNPSDLLSSALLSNLMEESTGKYDYVVVNAPPVLAYTDAALVSRAVTTTVLVASSARTTAEQLASAEEQLRNVRSELYGIVLVDATGASWENRRLRRRRRSIVRVP